MQSALLAKYHIIFFIIFFVKILEQLIHLNVCLFFNLLKMHMQAITIRARKHTLTNAHAGTRTPSNHYQEKINKQKNPKKFFLKAAN